MQFSPSNTYVSAVLICALVSPVLTVQASVPDETTTITLDQAVHFIGTDGSDAVADPGNYSVEAAQEWLRLIPGNERRDALLIEAQPGTHEVKVEIPIVISTPGSEPDELDIHIVQFLNPDGTSLVATGTYSGIQSRGLRDRARRAKQAAARARARAEGARRAAAAKAQQGANAARIAALKAKQAAEESAIYAAIQARMARPEEARVEEYRESPPKEIGIGVNTIPRASGWRRKVCQWIDGHIISQSEWGCQSGINLGRKRIRIKADHYGAGNHMIPAEAWVEMYIDFTLPSPSGSGQEQTKIADIYAPVAFHGKMTNTSPSIGSVAAYRMDLRLDEVSFDAEGRVSSTNRLETHRLEEDSVKVLHKPVTYDPPDYQGPNAPYSDVKRASRFNFQPITGRIYRLTLRVEVTASGLQVSGASVGAAFGSAVNFMDKATRLPKPELADGIGNVADGTYIPSRDDGFIEFPWLLIMIHS